MDRRSLLLIFSITFVLLFINQYFQQQNDQSVREWHEQQVAKKQEKISKLEALLQAHQQPDAEIPIVSFYADAEGKDFLGHGLLFDTNLLAFSADQRAIPTEIYMHTADNTSKKLTLAFKQEAQNGLLMYQEAPEHPLTISRLPEFGSFDLQLITPSNTQDMVPYALKLGNYTDGIFSVPQQELEKLKEQVNKDYVPSASPETQHALALYKKDGVYYPVGLYSPQQPSLTYLSDLSGLNTQVASFQSVDKIQNGPQEELFYVLETPYQQLVFSNYGGALAEINLPLQSADNRQSVVKEIEFDREMVAQHPNNAHFPAHPYFTPSESSQKDFNYHAQGKLGGYYPLLRRDLFQSGNRKTIRVAPAFYAFNFVSEYPEISNLVYTVKSFDKDSIVFEANQNFRRITKTYTLEENGKRAPYCVNCTIKIEGDSRGLWVGTGVPEVEIISGSPAPALKYRMTRKGKAEVINIDPPSEAFTVSSIYPDWLCNSNGFLGMILDPLTEIDPGLRVDHVSGLEVPSRLVNIGQDQFKAQNLPGFQALLPLKNSGGTMTFRLFAGPFSGSILKQVDAIFANPETGYNPDYIACQSFHGWFAFISEPFSKFLFILMEFFHSITGSWALSIILLTVALRVMLYPLNAWSTKSMLRMQQIAPEVKAIQERHKKDPKKAQLEIMNLYKERGVNPISGCLPLLIQMPFLIGMFDLLKSTFELRGASFIPGWIDNLTAPDVLFSWHTPIFLIGNQFHLLPILLGLVMFIQQRFMSAAPKDPNQMTDQERQQRVMGNMMAVVFTVMFYQFPSGLNIYWLSSMLLGMLQQWWMSKKMQKETVKILDALPAKAKGLKK
jgi:YidC/Oxa1 family membrane protein insertase